MIQSPTAGRRFSKTQKIIKMDESVDPRIIVNLVRDTLQEGYKQQQEASDHSSLSGPNKELIENKPRKQPVGPLPPIIFPINPKSIHDALHSNEFNAFELNGQTDKNALLFMMEYMFVKFNFEEAMRIDHGKFTALGAKLQQGYRPNPYHN